MSTKAGQLQLQRALIDNFPFLVWLKDTNSRFLAVNRAFAAACGIEDAPSIAGKCDLDVWPPDLAEAYRADDRTVMESREQKTVEEEIVEQGSREWFETFKAPVFTDEGQLLGTVGFSRDISERKNPERELADNEERLRELAAQSRTIVWEVDAQGLYTHVSEVSEVVFGYPPSELVGSMHFYDLHPEEGREAFKRAALAVFAQKEAFAGLHNRVQTKDGHEVWVSTNGIALLNGDGTLRGYRGGDLDITERKQAEAQLRVNAEKHEAILRTAMDGFWLVNAKGHLLEVNEAYSRMSGYSVEELLTMSVSDLESEEAAAETAAHITNVTARGADRFESRHRRKDETLIDVEVSAQLVVGGTGEITCFLRDITARKHLQDELTKQATTDELTQIFNRRHFIELAQREIKRSVRHRGPVTVALLDIDHFKHTNDTFGHAAGDQALVAFVSVCKTIIREIDVLARIGGDEFALLLPETTVEQAHSAAERIRLAVEELPIESADVHVSMTVSAGVAGLSGDDEKIDNLLRRADKALYQAKETGRNRTVVDSGAE